MPDETRQLQSCFLLHLVAALQGRLAYGGVPLASRLAPLDAIFSGAHPDLHAGKAALTAMVQEWGRQQENEPLLDAEVRETITTALGFLGRAMDQLLADSTDPDAFISAVLQCRDCIMALDLMLRAQAQLAGSTRGHLHPRHENQGVL